jgi:hypothetical protein
MSKFRPRNPQICPENTQPLWVYSSQVSLEMQQAGIRLIGQKAADHGGIIESFL